jgi:hypothetical protein
MASAAAASDTIGIDRIDDTDGIKGIDGPAPATNRRPARKFISKLKMASPTNDPAASALTIR